MKVKYTIYQIKNGENCDYLFRRFNEAAFDFSDYKEVYSGETDEGEEGDILDRLWVVFNIKIPKDFKGHSMSVSDVIKLGNKYWYVNDLGWIEITDRCK